MDISQESQEEEDWLLESLEKYEGIYMFELQQPTPHLEWAQEGSVVWVVCKSEEEKSSEILQLALPERLLPPEKQTLWAKRDFKLVNGAFVRSEITALKWQESSQSVISANSAGKIEIWDGKHPTNTDLLHRVDEFKLETAVPGGDDSILLDTCQAHPSLLLAGSAHSMQSLCLLDLASKKTLYQLPQETATTGRCLHAACFLDPEGQTSLLLTCDGAGALGVWDFRARASQVAAVTSTAGDNSSPSASALPSSHSLAVSPVSFYPHSQLALLDANNCSLYLHDTRRLHPPLASCVFGRPESLGTGELGGRRFNSSKHFPCVKYSPASPYTLSVSGVHRGVKLYDTATWSGEVKGEPPPLFLHSGHEVECAEAHVLVHSWQPGVQGTAILSADSQASLHAWQWKK